MANKYLLTYLLTQESSYHCINCGPNPNDSRVANINVCSIESNASSKSAENKIPTFSCSAFAYIPSFYISSLITFNDIIQNRFHP